MKYKKIVTATALTASFSAFVPLALAVEKPEEITVGIATFLSGSASVFGVPGRDAAELYIEELNAQGGIHGVPVRALFIDEGRGSSGMVSDYRRIVQEENADLNFELNDAIQQTKVGCEHV